MIHPKLKRVCEELEKWCRSNNVMFDWVCDETDLQGIMLFQSKPFRLIRYLQPIVQEGNIHVEYQKVRGGSIVAFSLEAISESRFSNIIAEAGEEPETMTFADRISNAFIEAPPIAECSDIPSVRAAMAKLNQPGMHVESREQAEFKAGDLWFNIGQAQRDFKNRQEFAIAVGEAWEGMQDRFIESAERIVGEGYQYTQSPSQPSTRRGYQYKSASSGTERSRNQDNPLGDKGITHQRAIGTGVDDEEPLKAQSPPRLLGPPLRPGESVKGATRGSAHGVSKDTPPGSFHPELRYEERIANALCTPKDGQTPSDFNLHLKEQLGGIATETGQDPSVLFKQFAKALQVLGQQMGLGPLQDRLRKQGISWKQSDDGQAIILTIKNATTKRDQPIARISHDTLAKPQEFETQLKSMLDFATGDAPGAFAQKEIEVADRKKAIGDIAKAVMPQDAEGEIAKAMNTDTGPEMASAGTAAMPKPQVQPKPQQRRPQPKPQQLQPQQQNMMAADKNKSRSTIE